MDVTTSKPNGETLTTQKRPDRSRWLGGWEPKYLCEICGKAPATVRVEYDPDPELGFDLGLGLVFYLICWGCA